MIDFNCGQVCFNDITKQLPPVAIIDQDGVITWSNRYDKHCTPCLLIGNHINEIIPELNLNRVFAQDEIICAPVGKTNYEIKIKPLSIDDAQNSHVLLFADLSYASDLEEKLNNYIEEIHLLNSIINVPYIGSIYVDREGVIRLVNNTFANYVGIRKDKLIGHRLEEYKIDPGLLNVIKTGKPDLLSFYPHPKLIATRTPVFKNGEIAGAYGQYIAIDIKAIRKRIFPAEEYVDIISRLQARDIMFYVNQFMVELNSYKDEFHKINTASIEINNIKGNNPKIQKLKNMVLMVANSPSSVLITGESGTGKELFAQSIHFHSRRSSFPFVKVNCAAIPENLLESELFGYVDGAFTGARRGGKMGKFEMADKGTIFLDEIGDMPLSMQAKLLRVLQEREIERVGDNKTIPIDVRIVSATNKDLNALVDKQTFRLDLYYRLNVVNLDIPPLRERTDDIPVIVTHLIQELNQKLSHNITQISPEAIDLLMQYHWPGNIRELMNVLETAMNFCRTSILKPENFAFFINLTTPTLSDKNPSLKEHVHSTEKSQIISALEIHNNDRKATAAMLGVSRTTLYRLMKKHQLL